MNLSGKTILITGGTGSFGKEFIKSLLDKFPTIRQIIVFSRDEQKQFEMKNELVSDKYNCLKYLLGDIRDRNRLIEVTQRVDILVHAAAMKHVPAAESNPMECIKTNILGSQNVIDAALINNVKIVVALSTDKAAAPANFYGASKLCLEKLFTYADSQKGSKEIRFSVVRYANVFGSKGSVVPLFLKLKDNGKLPITNPEMTRFSITMQNAVDLVYDAIENGWGGEIILPESASYKIVDLAYAIAPEVEQIIIGSRPGEKVHETMYTELDSYNTVKRGNYFVICPGKDLGLWGVNDYIEKMNALKVKENTAYTSNTNTMWLDVATIQGLIKNFIENR